MLGGILSEKEYQTWILIVRITELVFHSGRNGFTPDQLQLLHNLIWKHNILSEEVEGQSCVISMHNLTHLPADIKRFSSPDNYWCFVFERAVKGYIQRSSNKKHIEATFARAESRREALKFLPKAKTHATSLSTHHQKVNHLYTHLTQMQCLNLLQVLHATSLKQAQESYETHKPILVGGQKIIVIKSVDLQAVTPEIEFEEHEVAGISCRSILFQHHGFDGTLYRVGEHLLVSHAIRDEQQVIQVTTFFSVNHHGQYITFVMGKLYLQPDEDSIHPYSSNPIVEPTPEVVIALADNIIRKLMLYPDPENITSPEFYVVVDFQRPELPICAEDVIVPIFPVVGDMVLVLGENN